MARSKRLAAIVVAAALASAAACSEPPERLAVRDRAVVVFNDSGEAWTGVEIWVNDHYRVTRDRIAADERFVAPLQAFVAGFGQRFTATTNVTGVELTATDESGDPVRVTWGEGRRR